MLLNQKRQCWQPTVKCVSVCFLFFAVSLLYALSTSHINFNPPELPVLRSCAPPPGQPATNTCVPKVDIMFMKTHKTASSTFLNILLRFGNKHKLKFAFPNSRSDFFYPSPFEHTQVRGYKSGTCFNILCNHMRFNAPQVAKVLPLDTFYVTILRDPAELFESSFHYFGNIVPLTWRIPGKEKMAEFLRHPEWYFRSNGFNSFYLKNLQFFDLGQDNTLEPDDPRVDGSIRVIDERFHLVMLTEHFEESLILLKDALCWELDDVLFFKLNSRQKSAVSKLTPELRAKALRWNGVDWELYRRFNRTFWEKVEAYGSERMAEDVAELRRRNAELAEVCIEGGHSVEAGSVREAAMQPWQPIGEKTIEGYNLNRNVDEAHRELCRKMLTQEIQYLTELGANLWLTKLWGRVRSIINWLPVLRSCAPPPGQPASNTCVPKVDIMFMKTHKTASSTFLNILLRFGDKHKLKFAFPNSRSDFFYPSPFQHTQVRGYKSGTCEEHHQLVKECEQPRCCIHCLQFPVQKR